MTDQIERGRAGRVVTARLMCNADLVTGIEDACIKYGINRAFVKSGLGSLFRARLMLNEWAHPKTIEVSGFAVEVLSLNGEIELAPTTQKPAVRLYGIVANNQGTVFAGRFVKSEAPVCVTMEVIIQEWIAA
jgi:predicted DNA-binding protein with PD1-like motif